MNANSAERSSECEFIVVGAGPAGAAAAYYLAKAGYSVILLDRQSFPRDKVCGDFIGPLTIKELQRLDITESTEFKSSNPIKTARVYLDGNELICNSMPKLSGLPEQGRVIPRRTLDAWIANAARKSGATIFENVLVASFEVEKEDVKVVAQDSNGTHVFYSQLLIGADGSNSVIARLLRGYVPPKANRIIGVRGYYEGVQGPPNEANMHFASESFPGYCWLFPTGPNEANVGVGILLETMPEGNQPKELLERLIKENEGLRSRLKNAKLKQKVEAWPLNTYDPHLPIVGNRVMLIGEAAGLVNPLNGEGIQYALLSGRWAAETAINCSKNKDFSEDALSAYSKRVQDELSYGFKLSALIVQFIRNRNLNPLWLQTLEVMIARSKSDPEYANLAGGILSGLVPPTEALNAQFFFATLQEATISTGVRIISDAVNNPATLPENVVKVAQAGFEMAAQTVENPLGFLQWSMGTAARMFEFAAAVPARMLDSWEKDS